MPNRARVIGASIGLSPAAVSAVGNVLRADPHLVSMAPGILSMLVVPGAVGR